MKRNILPLVTLALAVTAASCMSLDEKLITGVSSQYYSTSDGLNSAVIASYAQLRAYATEPIGSLTEIGTDTWTVGDQGDITGTMRYLDNYGSQLNSNAGELSFFWNFHYMLINNLNAALDRGPNTPGLATSVKNGLLGEAHFMRALCYFALVQHFGGVTLSLHENQGVQVSATRAPVDSVYMAILADLDTAVAFLPATQSDFGRATKGAALTLRSKVYLTRAYQPFKGANDFASALAAANAVIAPGKYTLEPVYADLWCVARAADPGRGGYCENTGYNQNRSEFIFTVQYNYTQRDADVGGALQYNYEHLVYLGQYDNANSGVGIARDKNDGRPFRRFKPTQFELSLWNTRYAGTPGASPTLDTRFDGSFQTVWAATALLPGTNPAGASAIIVPQCPNTPKPVSGLLACTSNVAVNTGDTTILYTTFGVDSVRRRASKYTIRHTCPAGLLDPADYCGDNNQQNNGYIGWDRYPSLKKFQDNARTGDQNDQNGGKVLVLFRYAEVYLLAAEANLALGDKASAAANINVLRVRAANPALKNDPTWGTAYNTFTQVPAAQITLDFIMDERERELAGEFDRWYDMKRPGTAFFTTRIKKWNPKAVNIKDTHILRPIPQSQIDGTVQGPAYPQNPGY